MRLFCLILGVFLFASCGGGSNQKVKEIPISESPLFRYIYAYKSLEKTDSFTPFSVKYFNTVQYNNQEELYFENYPFRSFKNINEDYYVAPYILSFKNKKIDPSTLSKGETKKLLQGNELLIGGFLKSKDQLLVLIAENRYFDYRGCLENRNCSFVANLLLFDISGKITDSLLSHAYHQNEKKVIWTRINHKQQIERYELTQLDIEWPKAQKVNIQYSLWDWIGNKKFKKVVEKKSVGMVERSPLGTWLPVE